MKRLKRKYRQTIIVLVIVQSTVQSCLTIAKFTKGIMNKKN